ncbi:hypothetical protein F5X68DRAFT_263268 [Plectosphaerella plurivora]|uniref:CorA-like transporter domain-containing protein n=1 Tax=Plectosphaerella plurivora TaxID=936078 RepID=A0A9P8V8X0_9PEZI|nr:hypothetical protein F5X68DRAFT_263268 [Plectosphaerella plurivora]
MSWDQYFVRQRTSLVPPAALRGQLDDLVETALVTERPIFHVLDIDKDSVHTDVVRTNNDLDRVCESSPTSGIRIISISSTRTITPLRITSSMAARLFSHHNVRLDFLRVLLSFGGEPHQSEANSANSTFVQLGDDAYTLLYKLNYVEDNGRRGLDDWSFRHIGVYHHHTPGLDMFVLLHCQPASEVSMTLDDLMDDVDGQDEVMVEFRQGLFTHPAMLHHFVLCSYLDNWRSYLRHLGDRFSAENNNFMVPHPYNRSGEYAAGTFRNVLGLRNIKDFSLFASACCRSNLEVTGCILRSNKLPNEQASELQSMETVLRGYIESSAVLRQRIDNTVDLASYHHFTSNQQGLQTLTREMETLIKNTGEVTLKLKDLTEDTVDDSPIVRIITIISAVYLPGSFVGSIFGSNYFSFNETTRRIAIARDFWVFALLWLGLTLVTAAVYVYTFIRKRKPRPSSGDEAAPVSGFSTKSGQALWQVWTRAGK